MAEIGCNLIPDFGPLDAAALPPSGEALVDPAGEAASAAADDCRQCLHLPVVGMIINIEAGDPRRLSRPEVALPAADPHKAEIIELDVAIMALADAPEQHRFTKTVIRRLGKGARAGYCAAAVVEPVADDMPARNVAHPGPPIGCYAETIAGFGGAGRALLWDYSRTEQVRGCRGRISRDAVTSAIGRRHRRSR